MFKKVNPVSARLPLLLVLAVLCMGYSPGAGANWLKITLSNLSGCMNVLSATVNLDLLKMRDIGVEDTSQSMDLGDRVRLFYILHKANINQYPDIKKFAETLMHGDFKTQRAFRKSVVKFVENATKGKEKIPKEFNVKKITPLFLLSTKDLEKAVTIFEKYFPDLAYKGKNKLSHYFPNGGIVSNEMYFALLSKGYLVIADNHDFLEHLPQMLIPVQRESALRVATQLSEINGLLSELHRNLRKGMQEISGEKRALLSRSRYIQGLTKSEARYKYSNENVEYLDQLRKFVQNVIWLPTNETKTFVHGSEVAWVGGIPHSRAQHMVSTHYSSSFVNFNEKNPQGYFDLVFMRGGYAKKYPLVKAVQGNSEMIKIMQKFLPKEDYEFAKTLLMDPTSYANLMAQAASGGKLPPNSQYSHFDIGLFPGSEATHQGKSIEGFSTRWNLFEAALVHKIDNDPVLDWWFRNGGQWKVYSAMMDWAQSEIERVSRELSSI